MQGGAQAAAKRCRELGVAAARRWGRGFEVAGRGYGAPARRRGGSAVARLRCEDGVATGHEHGVAVGVEDGGASRALVASRQKLDEVLSKTGVAARWRSMAAPARSHRSVDGSARRRRVRGVVPRTRRGRGGLGREYVAEAFMARRARVQGQGVDPRRPCSGGPRGTHPRGARRPGRRRRGAGALQQAGGGWVLGRAPLLARVGGAHAFWAWRLGPWRGMGSRLGRGGGKGRSQGLSASWARGKRRTSWAEGGVLGWCKASRPAGLEVVADWVRRRRKVFSIFGLSTKECHKMDSKRGFRKGTK